MVFVGPSPETLEAFGDKAKARALAERCGVALPAGVQEPVDLEGARRFMAGLEPGAAVILKAVSGGGGRGIRPVGDAADLAEAFERCAAEARSAFGDGALYIERFLPRARHIEVQVLGDGTGDVAHLWERECSLQRRRQKIIEAAPAPNLPAEVRDGMLRDALALAAAVRYRGVGTFEFLAWREGDGRDAYAFIEANPRIQVEHTVTEAITGVDLVALQIRLAAGARLADVGLAGETVAPRGAALQARVNMERMQSDGQARPSGGRITAFEPPSGPGVRVDSYAYVGYRTSPAYDSLLAKVIVHAPDGNHGAAVRKLRRSLARCRIAGVDTNLAFLRAILARPEVEAGEVTTRFIDDNAAELVEASAAFLSVAAVDAAPEDDRAATAAEAHPGEPLAAPLQGTVVSVGPTVGDLVPAGRTVAVLEAMKMEHLVTAPFGGRVTHVAAAPGAMLFEGEALLWLEPDDAAVATSVEAAAHDPDHIRPDLAAVLARRALTRDEGRPEAVARRRGKGRRTARENVAALCDDGSFHEYGSSVVAAQHQRRSLDDLIRNTPADGLVCGIGAVNGDAFGPERSRAVVLAYDETVLAGTQGRQSHRKDCRMFDLARRLKLPVIFFTEGGGGRPGDTERPGEPFSFYLFGRLSGVAPTIGVASGYCFGGNAAFLGCCHITIATQDASIGMGGPAMIEGGGLGVFKASEVGPAPTLYRHGAVDLLVKDEAEAAQAARACLAYFQGAIAPGPCPDQRRLRDLVPEDRRRAYDIRPIIETLADEGSVLELRGGWGQGMITCFARVEGRPIGIVANNPRHLGGAVDGDGAEKAARFVQLCDNFGIPLLMLCDTPGIMVGPEAEKTGIMRRTSRLLVAGANVRVPLLTVIVRKAYGIGMLAMMGAAYKAPIFNVAWPTAEYGGMGLEGAVKLGFRKELEAIENLAERQGFYDAKVAALYEQGKALTKATSFDFDEVIDPAETRSWILNGLYAAGPIDSTPRHPFVSTW
jgi:acetyl-CoA carboxylase carboxyltransferase component/acetyl/propionyl-CoA carboxylase alpha subunit